MDLQNQMGKLQQDSGFKQTFFFYLQALLKRFSQLCQVHAVDGKVVGDAEFFQKLETDIKEP